MGQRRALPSLNHILGRVGVCHFSKARIFSKPKDLRLWSLASPGPRQQRTPLRLSSAPHIFSSYMLLLSHLQALSTLATVLGFLVSLVIKWQGFHRRRRNVLFATFFLCWLLSSHGSLNLCEESKVRWRWGFGVVCSSELTPRFVVGLSVCCGFTANCLNWDTEPKCRKVPLFSGWKRLKGVSVQFIFKDVCKLGDCFTGWPPTEDRVRRN